MDISDVNNISLSVSNIVSRYVFSYESGSRFHARLEQFPKLSSVRIFEEIRAAGYDGGCTQREEYVREARPAPPPEPLVPLRHLLHHYRIVNTRGNSYRMPHHTEGWKAHHPQGVEELRKEATPA